ncbi:MAG: YybH family protein, partial [Phycisphaerales bacterium]
MKLLSGLATLALIGLCSCAGSPKQPASQPKAEAQIDEFTTKFLVEWNERDSDGLAGLFTDDGVRVVSGEQLPATGRDAIARSFAQTMGDPSLTEKVNLNITVAHARDLGNGIVIADGRFEATDPDGTVTLTGKWGNVFRQTDDGLRLLLESAHAEPAADADPDRFANM